MKVYHCSKCNKKLSFLNVITEVEGDKEIYFCGKCDKEWVEDKEHKIEISKKELYIKKHSKKKSSKMVEVTEYYCSKCGEKVGYTDIHCKKCRSMLATDGATKSKKVKVLEEDFESDVKGIGGWLLFFIIIQILRIIIFLGVTISVIYEYFMRDLVIEMNNPSYQNIYIILMGLSLLSMTFFLSYAIYSLFKLDDNAIPLAKMSCLLPPNLFFFFYLTYSERVANTFPKDKRYTLPIDIIWFVGTIVLFILAVIVAFI